MLTLEPQPIEPNRSLAAPENSQPRRLLQGMESFRALLGVVSRSRLGRLFSFGGKRDYEEIFGWNKLVTIQQIMYMYNRGGIAKRVIDAYPDAIWARPPEIWSQGDDSWSSNWSQFSRNMGLWQALHRLDKLSRLGQYAILVVGTDGGRLDQPLTRASKILYLQPYGEESVQIKRYVTDQNNPLFGKPEAYQVYPDVSTTLMSRNQPLLTPTSGTGAGITRVTFEVHASRCIHVARSSLEDEIFGQPSMLPIWDYLVDLRKVIGSSSESYWIMANRGLQADVDKEMSLNADDQAALQSELDDFYNGYRRFIRTKGVDIKELKNEVADPLNPFNVLVTLIAGATGIPQRVLVGSEQGSLASTQDKGNWAERIEEDRALFCQPRVIKPFLQFCLQYNLIPQPKGSVEISWPDAYRMSPLERGQTSAQTARTIANITKMLESPSKRAQGLMSDVELRALIGVSTDNRILADNPDP